MAIVMTDPRHPETHHVTMETIRSKFRSGLLHTAILAKASAGSHYEYTLALMFSDGSGATMPAGSHKSFRYWLYANREFFTPNVTLIVNEEKVEASKTWENPNY